MAAQPSRLELFERIEDVVRAELRAIQQDDHNREAGLVYVDGKRVKHARGRGHSFEVDEDRQSHVRGNLSERSAYGIMGPDVTACRTALRAIGITLSVAETEAAMRQLQALDDGTIVAHRGAGNSQDERKAKNAAKMRAWREKKYAEGFCRTCGIRTREADSDYCALCLHYGSERSKKSHQRKRGLAPR